MLLSGSEKNVKREKSTEFHTYHDTVVEKKRVKKMSNSEPEAEVAEDSVATENAEVGLIFYQELQPY